MCAAVLDGGRQFDGGFQFCQNVAGVQLYHGDGGGQIAGGGQVAGGCFVFAKMMKLHSLARGMWGVAVVG